MGQSNMQFTWEEQRTGTCSCVFLKCHNSEYLEDVQKELILIYILKVHSRWGLCMMMDFSAAVLAQQSFTASTVPLFWNVEAL